MKTSLEIIKFDIKDIITASGDMGSGGTGTGGGKVEEISLDATASIFE